VIGRVAGLDRVGMTRHPVRHRRAAVLAGVAAGTLDDPTGLQLTANIYTEQAADSDALPDDGIVRDPDSSYVPRWS